MKGTIMTSNLLIRLAKDADRDAVFYLARDLATSFEVGRQEFKSVFDRIQREDSIWLGVAESNAEVIGYLLGLDHLTFYANGRVAWIEEVVVRQDWRRRGVGQALTAAFESWTANRGAKLIALATRRAAKFYQSLGYEESATYFRKLV